MLVNTTGAGIAISNANIDGVANDGVFTNSDSAQVTVDSSGFDGFYMTSGSSLFNLNFATITVSASFDEGIDNSGHVFNGSNSVVFIGNSNSDGIANNGTFTNTGNAQITVDVSLYDGFYNTSAGTATNSNGAVFIAKSSDDDGIHNDLSLIHI